MGCVGVCVGGQINRWILPGPTSLPFTPSSRGAQHLSIYIPVAHFQIGPPLSPVPPLRNLSYSLGSPETLEEVGLAGSVLQGGPLRSSHPGCRLSVPPMALQLLIYLYRFLCKGSWASPRPQDTSWVPWPAHPPRACSLQGATLKLLFCG